MPIYLSTWFHLGSRVEQEKDMECTGLKRNDQNVYR